jgi:WD40 repeat protein/serine/threonine protein kinase
MAQLSLSLLGEFRAALDEQAVTTFRTRLAQAILIYLVVQPERHRREHLMSLFWPDLPQASAQQNLRQNLYLLRQSIAAVDTRDGRSMVPLLLAERDFLQLNPMAAVHVDVRRLDALLDRIEPGSEELHEVVELYRGDFLADFYLPYSTPFEEWTTGRRETYRRRVMEVMGLLVDRALVAGEYEDAENIIRRQLAIDPLHEAANRRLIETLARREQRNAAISHFEAYRELLHRDLQLPPGAETLNLVDQVRTGELTSYGVDRRPVRGYELHEELGRSSHAVVYRAIQTAVRRDVALKVIAARYADNSDFIRRFEAEARIIAKLEHPHIIPLYDYWREPGGAYLVMRLMRGGNLRLILAGGELPVPRTVELLDQVASALQEAHEHGIIHCDVKPGNILLDDAGNAYLTDFGIARLLQAENDPDSRDIFFGTPDYISPEQVKGEPVSPLSDQYSLGMVVYECLTGQTPYKTNSLVDLVRKHLNDPLPPVHDQRREIPPAVDAVLQRATAKEPADRYPTVRAFALALRAAALSAGDSTAIDGPLLPLRNPYMGLLPFTEADTALFYGREAMTAQLIQRLDKTGPDHRFLAVVGPSGSGKSSLVKAGLLPALRSGALPGSEKWFIVETAIGPQPFEELAAALLRVALYPTSDLLEQIQRDERGLLESARQLLPAETGNELLLVIDQFEELFTQVQDPAVTVRYLDNLATALADSHCRLWVIITLRADFYDRPLLHPQFSRMMRDRTEVVIPLTPEELNRAIVRPAARVGIEIEPELVSRMVADVREQPGALPLLQYSLCEMFSNREDGLITRQVYDRIGGIRGALSTRAEAVYNGLTPAGQQATRALFSRLVTLGSGLELTRRRALLAELTALDLPEGQPKTTEPAPILRAIEEFGRSRLLSFDHDQLTRGSTVEIAHEALLEAWPRLALWLDSDRTTIRLSRLLAQATVEWQEAGRDESYLLRGSRLNLLSSLAESHIALTEEERFYLQQSLEAQAARQAAEEARRQKELEIARSLAEVEAQRAAEQTRAASRLRRLAVLLSAALLLAAIAFVLVINFARQAGHNADVAATREIEALANADLAATRETEALTSARLATSRELSQAAYNALAIDPELSILLALQALENADTKEAQEALHQALQTTRTIIAFPTGAQGHFGALFAADPNGTRLATAGDSFITLWETTTGAPLQTLPLAEVTSEHYQIAFNDAGDYLTLLSADPSLSSLSVQTWRFPGGEAELPQSIPLSINDSSPVTLSGDGRFLAAGFEDGRVEVWDVAAARRVMVIDEQSAAIVDVAFDPGGRLLASAGRDGVVSLWDVAAAIPGERSEPVATIDGSAGFQALGNLVHIEFMGETGLALGYLGGVEVWNVAEPDRPLYALQGPIKLTRDFAAGLSGTLIATGGQEGTANIWDMSTGSHRLTLAQHAAPIDDLAFSPDERRLYSLDRSGILRVWDARLAPLGELATLSVDPAVFDLEISPDGRQIALGNAGGPASVWDLATGERLHVMPGEFGAVYRVAYSPDGRRLATVGTDNIIRIWSMPAGALLNSFSGHGSGLAGGLFPGTMDVAFSPDGTRLVTAGADGLAILWDAVSGQQLMTLAGHTDSLHSLAWSPDGRYIATTSDEDDTSVRVWNATTGELIYELLGHVVRVWGLAFSPDSQTLITGGARGIIKAWDMATGQNLFTVVDEADHIGTVTFTPDGQFFITTGEVPLRLRRSSDGAEVLTLAQPLIWSARVSPDGRWLYAADVEGVVRVMALNTADAVTLAGDRLNRWWRPEECRRYLHSEFCPAAPPRLAER